MKKRYYLHIAGVAVLLFFMCVESGSALLVAPMVWFDNTEDTFVDNVLLDLSRLSDETVSSKVFFLDIPILTYHQVRPITDKDDENFRRFITSPEEFERQLRYLKENGYTVIPLNDVINHLASSSPLRGKYVVLTFDDGYQSQYQYAFPLLKEYGDTATFFIYTNAIHNLKRAMTWEEVINLDKEGMSIGAHTKSHTMLTKISDEKQLEEEIQGSKDDLEAHIHKPVELFAYPYGQYNDAIVKNVKKDGFLGAVSVIAGQLQTYDQRFSLKRYNVNDGDHEFLWIFEKKQY